MKHKKLVQSFGFEPKENSVEVFIKEYPHSGGYSIEVDFKNSKINYGLLITAESKATQNFSDEENWVVLECVNRLLDKGYSAKNIVLEKTWPSGHGTSGRLDILVLKDDGSAYLMIECKTYGAEFEKEKKRLLKDGGQLFTYFQQDTNAEVLMLYSSELNSSGKLIYRNEIVKIEEDYRETSNVKDFYDRWSKLPKANGVFDSWVAPYAFQSKALTFKTLKDITQDDSSFIFNQFLEILRHNVVSDKPNAFNKIFTLFLCKIYDEKNSKPNDELAFQWFYTPYTYDGISYPPDDNISFQKRLTDLYKKGMKAFLEKDVVDLSDADFTRKYASLDSQFRKLMLDDLTEVRLKKNNEFAIKEVFDDVSFEENAKVVKEVVELLQGYKIRYTKKQQYLSDFFELLLTTGLKQESGQFFTPVPIAQFIIKSLPLDHIINQQLEKAKEGEPLLPAVIDYASGSGHFITESMHEIQRIIDKTDPNNFSDKTAKKLKNWKEDHFDWALQYVYGIEKDYRLVKVGKVGCYLHGDGLAKIVHSDGLANFSKTAEYTDLLSKTDKDFPKENKQFDIVLSNPPYSVSAFKGNASKYYNQDDFTLYDKLTDQSGEIECLFVERMQQLLKDGGLAGIILPNTILSNSGIYAAAREIILQYFEIIAITELGGNTFMATNTSTVVLFLRRRNNYDSKNIRDSVNNAIKLSQDITINGIEKAMSTYVSYVWSGLDFSDYQTLLRCEPNKAILEHANYQEYLKLKADKKIGQSQANLLAKIVELEVEKVFYFILAYPQKVVLIKTGIKNDEKRFLGYEFSNRRNNEGIHPLQRSKTIEECTRLFDPHVFDNPEKASTYIYQAFLGDHSSTIHTSLEKNITRVNLIDMIAFDRMVFDKNLQTTVKKKIELKSKWSRYKLGELANIEYGTRIVKQSGEGTLYPVYGGGGETFKSDSFNRQDAYIISRFGMSEDCARYIKGEFFLNDSGMTLNSKKALLTTEYLNYYLFLNQDVVYRCGRGVAQKNIDIEEFKSIEIPCPPLDIQEKIVTACNKIESEIYNSFETIIQSRSKISDLFTLGSFPSKQLGEIVQKVSKNIQPSEKDGEVFYIGLENIESRTGLLIGDPSTTYDNIKSTKACFQKFDVLYGKLRPNLNKVYLAQQDGICSTDILVFRFKNQIQAKTYAHYFLTTQFNDEVLKGVSGQQLPRTSWDKMSTIQIPNLMDEIGLVKKIEQFEKVITQSQKAINTAKKRMQDTLEKYL